MATDDAVLRAILLIVAAFLLLPLVMMVVMMPVMGAGHGWMWNGAVGGWWWVLPWFVTLAILVGAGYLLYATLWGSDDKRDPALEELRTAYARGDLTDEEFEQRRERLERGR